MREHIICRLPIGAGTRLLVQPASDRRTLQRNRPTEMVGHALDVDPHRRDARRLRERLLDRPT